MKLKLAFHDWLAANGQQSIYDTESGIELSLSDFHHGTIFDATIELDEHHDALLRRALASGCLPAFYGFEEVTP